MRKLLVGAVLCVAACEGTAEETESRETDAGETESEELAPDCIQKAFKPAAPLEGYTRFTPPPIELAPGEDGVWCQWVAGPSDEDRDVVDVLGEQSEVGHHAILYSTTAHEPVGTTRPCEDADQLQMRFLGGLGGEGSSAVKLPEGTVFRLRKGRSLMVNAHYMNSTCASQVGASVIDIKLTKVDPAHRVAAFFTNVDTGIDVQPMAESTLEVSCTLKHDLEMLWWANHMHDHGLRTFSERVRLDGTVEELRRDDHWDGSWANDPQFVAWPADAPLLMKAGETIRTSCTWRNETQKPVGFPAEMCAGLGFFLGEQDILCVAGAWIE